MARLMILKIKEKIRDDMKIKEKIYKEKEENSFPIDARVGGL